MAVLLDPTQVRFVEKYFGVKIPDSRRLKVGDGPDPAEDPSAELRRMQPQLKKMLGGPPDQAKALRQLIEQVQKALKDGVPETAAAPMVELRSMMGSGGGDQGGGGPDKDPPDGPAGEDPHDIARRRLAALQLRERLGAMSPSPLASPTLAGSLTGEIQSLLNLIPDLPDERTLLNLTEAVDTLANRLATIRRSLEGARDLHARLEKLQPPPEASKETRERILEEIGALAGRIVDQPDPPLLKLLNDEADRLEKRLVALGEAITAANEIRKRVGDLNPHARAPKTDAERLLKARDELVQSIHEAPGAGALEELARKAETLAETFSTLANEIDTVLIPRFDAAAELLKRLGTLRERIASEKRLPATSVEPLDKALDTAGKTLGGWADWEIIRDWSAEDLTIQTKAMNEAAESFDTLVKAVEEALDTIEKTEQACKERVASTSVHALKPAQADPLVKAITDAAEEARKEPLDCAPQLTRMDEAAKAAEALCKALAALKLRNDHVPAKAPDGALKSEIDALAKARKAAEDALPQVTVSIA